MGGVSSEYPSDCASLTYSMAGVCISGSFRIGVYRTVMKSQFDPSHVVLCSVFSVYSWSA